MRENNGDLVRTDTLGCRIKNFFIHLFGGKKQEAKINFKDMAAETIAQNPEDKRVTFIQQIKSEKEETDEDKTLRLVQLLKSKRMEIGELTATQKEEVIAFLQEEIANKKFKLQSLKNKALYDKLKKREDKDAVLSQISETDKTSFIEYLKKEIETKKARLQKLKPKSSNI